MMRGSVFNCWKGLPEMHSPGTGEAFRPTKCTVCFWSQTAAFTLIEFGRREGIFSKFCNMQLACE